MYMETTDEFKPERDFAKYLEDHRQMQTVGRIDANLSGKNSGSRG